MCSYRIVCSCVSILGYVICRITRVGTLHIPVPAHIHVSVDVHVTISTDIREVGCDVDVLASWH